MEIDLLKLLNEFNREEPKELFKLSYSLTIRT